MQIWSHVKLREHNTMIVNNIGQSVRYAGQLPNKERNQRRILQDILDGAQIRAA